MSKMVMQPKKPVPERPIPPSTPEIKPAKEPDQPFIPEEEPEIVPEKEPDTGKPLPEITPPPKT